jgi:hypothetical protein
MLRARVFYELHFLIKYNPGISRRCPSYFWNIGVYMYLDGYILHLMPDRVSNLVYGIRNTHFAV